MWGIDMITDDLNKKSSHISHWLTKITVTLQLPCNWILDVFISLFERVSTFETCWHLRCLQNKVCLCHEDILGSRGIYPFFRTLGTRWRLVVNFMPARISPALRPVEASWYSTVCGSCLERDWNYSYASCLSVALKLWKTWLFLFFATSLDVVMWFSHPMGVTGATKCLLSYQIILYSLNK
jgi:hypothetical protein